MFGFLVSMIQNLLVGTVYNCFLSERSYIFNLSGCIWQILDEAINCVYRFTLWISVKWQSLAWISTKNRTLLQVFYCTFCNMLHDQSACNPFHTICLFLFSLKT